MKGLLLKDFYVMKGNLLLFLVMALFFCLIPGYSMLAFVVVYSALLPISALAYEERCKWSRLCALLPCSPRQVVLSKYVLGYGITAAAILLTLVLKGVFSLFRPEDLSLLIPVGLTLFAVAVTLMALVLPFIYWLGVEKGRLLYFLAIFLVCGAAGGASALLDLQPRELLQQPLFWGIGILAVVLLQFGSIALSLRLSRKGAAA